MGISVRWARISILLLVAGCVSRATECKNHCSDGESPHTFDDEKTMFGICLQSSTRPRKQKAHGVRRELLFGFKRDNQAFDRRRRRASTPIVPTVSKPIVAGSGTAAIVGTGNPCA